MDLVFLCGEGPRSRNYGRTAALRIIVQPCDEDDYFIFVFPCNGAPVEWNGKGKTEVLGEKPVPVPLCPPQIPRGPTRASAVRGRWQTAWAMARPTWTSYTFQLIHETNPSTSTGPVRQVRTQNFSFGRVGADPEAIYNLCLF
jgi:hypothetical protein